jgi:hypothetical protein
MTYFSTLPITPYASASPELGHVLSVIAKFRNAPVECIPFYDPLVEELLSYERWALDVLYERYSLELYGPLSVLTVRRFFEDFDNQSTNACDSFLVSPVIFAPPKSAQS